MHPADKAVLRLAIGLGLSVLVAYGLALQVPFVACVLAVVMLCNPGPPMPFVKGVVVGLVVAGVLLAGVLLVPIMENYAAAGVLLVAALLYAVFFAGARKPSPLSTFLVVAFTIMPAAGVADQQLITVLSKAFGVGLCIAIAVNGLSHSLFPDPPRPAAPKAKPGVSAEAARWSALQATLAVMPVFLLALTNPPMYLPAIMKTVLMGQQMGSTNARSAGRELVGSTALGAVMAALVWGGLTLRPNLWMLMLWVTAAAFWTGARLVRIRPTSQAPSYWLNALMTMLILLGPAIEDSANGKDVYLASAFRVTLFIAVAIYGWALVWLLERWRAARTAPLSLNAHGGTP